MNYWRRHAAAGLALLAGASAAAAMGARHIEWFGVLKPVNGASIAGNAGMVAGERDGSTEVSLVLSGATSGAVYAWVVLRGHCDGSGGRTLGTDAQYKAATANATGGAEVTVTLPVALPDSGTFHVRVRASGQRAATVLACGNLYLED